MVWFPRWRFWTKTARQHFLGLFKETNQIPIL
jgi:hypothetical protein